MKSIAIIGNGRMARFLAQRLQLNYSLHAIVARDIAKATSIAKKYKCKALSVRDFDIDSVDIALLAISDDAIHSIVTQLGNTTTILIHTSGTKPIELLSAYSANCGVLWPLVSISDATKIEGSINCSCEASNAKTKREVFNMVKVIGALPIYQTSIQREVTHLAAVMVNNFVNQIYYSANQILQQHEIKSSILHNIILSTAENAVRHGAENVQTGPASRGDKTTMQRHLQLLKKNSDLSKIYKAISESIMNNNPIK